MTTKGADISKTRAAAVLVLRELCGSCPEALPSLLLSPLVTAALKADLVLRYVRHHAQFPPACDPLWKDNPPVGGPRQERLLGWVFARLDADVLAKTCLPGLAPRFLGAENCWQPLLDAFLQGCAADPARQRLVPALVERMREDILFFVLQEHGAELRKWYPRAEEKLSARLPALLAALPEQPRKFERRLEVLGAWREWFADAELAEDRLGHWDGVRTWLRIIRKMREQERQLSSVARRLRKINYAMAAHDLAECLEHAMPPEAYPEDRHQRLRSVLHSLAEAIAPDPVFWKSNVAAAIQRCLEDGRWPEGPLYLE